MSLKKIVLFINYKLRIYINRHTICCIPLVVNINLACIKPYKTSAAVSTTSCCSSFRESTIKGKHIDMNKATSATNKVYFCHT